MVKKSSGKKVATKKAPKAKKAKTATHAEDKAIKPKKKRDVFGEYEVGPGAKAAIAEQARKSPKPFVSTRNVALKSAADAEKWVTSFAADRGWDVEIATLYLLNVAHGRLEALRKDREKRPKKGPKQPKLPHVDVVPAVADAASVAKVSL